MAIAHSEDGLVILGQETVIVVDAAFGQIVFESSFLEHLRVTGPQEGVVFVQHDRVDGIDFHWVDILLVVGMRVAD